MIDRSLLWWRWRLVECKNLSKLGLEGLLLLKNSGLVGQHCTHISAERLHVLCEEDSVLLGLVLEGIKALSKGEHRVLEVGGMPGVSYLCGLRLWWWRWVGRGLPNIPLGIAQGSKTSLIIVKLVLVLVRGLMTGIRGPLRSWDTRFVPLD